jgi:protein ImuB
MTIPSYDDLTPGIPDVLDSKSVSRLASFLRDDLQQRSGDAAIGRTSRDLPSTCLYACLRIARLRQGFRLRQGSGGQVGEAGERQRETANGQPQTANGQPQTANGQPQTADCQLPTLLAIARDFSPRIMRAGDREVLLDVSGLGRLIGEPPAIARELRRAIVEAGLEADAVAVAIATSQTAARLMAAAPGAATRLPDDAISGLPVSLLPPLETLPPAMNHRDRARPYETFEKWGIATLGDLAALPAADLSSRLGRRGVALQRLARGLDPRPFVPDLDTPRFVGRLELEWPIETLEPLSFVFARLLEPLSAALERADRGAAAVRLDLRLTDRTTHARVLQLPAPMRDPRVLRTLLLLDLESRPPSTAVDVVAIELDPAPARITQFSLLARALPSPETLSTLTARLSALVGESRIGSPVLLDTHAPGAFEMERFAPDRGAQSAQGAQGAQGAPPVLRRQRIPPAIRVRVEQGRPVYLASSRRGMPHGAITQAAGPWRTSGGWWTQVDLPPEGGSHEPSQWNSARASGGGAPRAWNQDEWDVALTSGVVCRIYHDRTTERWFLEGVYD